MTHCGYTRCRSRQCPFSPIEATAYTIPLQTHHRRLAAIHIRKSTANMKLYAAVCTTLALVTLTVAAPADLTSEMSASDERNVLAKRGTACSNGIAVSCNNSGASVSCSGSTCTFCCGSCCKKAQSKASTLAPRALLSNVAHEADLDGTVPSNTSCNSSTRVRRPKC